MYTKTASTYYKPMNRLLLHSRRNLAKVIDKINQLRLLNQCLSDILEPKVGAHFQIASYQDGKLVILADNSAWATKLRYEVPQLIENLKKKPKFYGLTHIKIIISLSTLSQKESKSKLTMPILSPKSAELIIQTAKAQKDPALKAALLKLSENTTE